MFVLSSVGIFFRLGEHVFFNTWWHMRVPVTDLMNSRGRGGECPPKTSNPFLGPCVWILVYKKPNFPGLFQTSEFRCLFLRPLWYEDTLSWTIDFATWNAHPPHPTNPLQCNAYPSLGPYTFLEFLYAYTKCVAAQRTKDFFFIRWFASTRQNQFNYRDVFKYRKTTTQRYKCIFLLKGRLNKVKDNLLILYDYLHSNFIQSLSYVEDFNPYTVSTKTKNSINYKKYKLQYRQELK